MKKLLVLGVVFIILLVTALIALPFLFKDKVAEQVKVAINNQVNAEVNFGDVGLSWFKNFPNLTASINDVSVVNNEPFKDIKLLDAKNLSASVNLLSVLKDEIIINSVTLHQPKVNISVLKDGSANYNITKDENGGSEDDNASGNSALQLSKYAIKDGQLKYVDDNNDLAITINNLNHTGKGNFTSYNYLLSTETQLLGLTVNSSGSSLLNNVNVLASIDADIDNEKNIYQLAKNSIAINDLAFSLTGKVVNAEPLNLNLVLDAPKVDFKGLLSLIPAIYAENFNDLTADGQADLSGFVKGTYADEAYPAFKLQAQIKDGSFKYKGFDGTVNPVNGALIVEHSGGDLSKMVVNIPQLNAKIDQQNINIKGSIASPTTDPNLDIAVKADVDLSTLANTFPMEELNGMSGQLVCDVTAKGKLSDYEKGNYNQFHADGNMVISNMLYNSTSMNQEVSIAALDLSFNPQDVKLNDFKAKAGETDLNATGTLSNFFSYAFKDEVLTGNVLLQSTKINLNEWMTETEEDNGTEGTATAFEVPDQYDLTIDADISEVIYEDWNLQDVKGKMLLKDETIILKNVAANTLEGSVVFNGSYSTKANKINPFIDMDLRVTDVDVEKTFNTLNSVQKIAPIAQFIDGNASANIKLEGDLNEDLSPQLMSLNGDGNAAVIRGTLKNFEPLTKLAEILSINRLKKIDIVSLRAFFELKEGRVSLEEPFTFDYDDMDFIINGSHGLDQSLDYTLKTMIPKEKINPVVYSKFNFLVSQAGLIGSKVGLKAPEMPDKIPLNIKVGGTLNKPKIQPDFEKAAKDAFEMAKGTFKEQIENKVKDEVNQKKEEVKEEVKKEVDKAKDKAKDEAQKAVDKAKDKAKDEIKDKGKEVLDGLFGKKKKK